MANSFTEKYYKLIPAVLLLFFCIPILWACITGVEFNGAEYVFEPGLPHYLTFIFTILCWLSFFFARIAYKYILGATVLLGLFGIVQLTVLQQRSGLHIGSLSIHFQFSAFLGGIAAYLVNYKTVNSFIFSGSKANNPTEEKRSTPVYDQEQIEKYKNNFSYKSVEELKELTTSTKFRAEAREAARLLLTEKENQ